MPIHHVALKSAEPARLAGWYGRVLGLAELRRFEDARGVRSVWLDLGGSILMVERAEGERSADPIRGWGWHGVYLQAEPGAGGAWVDRARAQGVESTHQTRFTVYFVDPDGNEVGVSSYPELIGLEEKVLKS